MDCEQQINSSEQIKMTEEIKMTDAEWEAEQRKGEFHTNILFPAVFHESGKKAQEYDYRFFTPKWATSYDTIVGGNRERFEGYVLKKGIKITPRQFDHLTDNEEFKRFYAKNTILTVSQTTADHSNQDLYEDITARIDRGRLRYAFKDRIPKGKHIFAVLVPTRSNPAWKNCPNYDISYKNPVMMVAGDKGAVKVGEKGCFAMNPLGDAIIVLKE